MRVTTATHAGGPPAAVLPGVANAGAMPMMGTPGDIFMNSASTGSDALNRAQGASTASPASANALNRVSDILQQAMIAGSSLLSASAQGAMEDAKSSNDKIAANQSKIDDHYKAKQAHTRMKIASLKKQIAAKKDSGFFGTLLKVFKGIAAAVAVVGAIGGGPLAIIAAGLLAASFFTSLSDSETMQWVSFGLAAAGALVSVGTAIAQACGKLAAQGAKTALQTACQWGEWGLDLAQAPVVCGQKMADADLLNAQADEKTHVAGAENEKREADQLTDNVQDSRQFLTQIFTSFQRLISIHHAAMAAGIGAPA